MKLLVALALSGTTFVGVVPTAETSAPNRYLVALKVTGSGASLGEPRLVVASGEPARILIARPDGSKFDMRISVSRDENATVSLNAQIEIVAQDGRQCTGSQVLQQLPLDTTAAKRFGQAPACDPVTIHYTVSKSSPAAQS